MTQPEQLHNLAEAIGDLPMWVLIIMTLASSSGKAIETTEFTSKAACQRAADKIHKATDHLLEALRPITICTPK